METGVACHAEKAEMCDAECQTYKGLSELANLVKKGTSRVEERWLCLTEKPEKIGSTNIFQRNF